MKRLTSKAISKAIHEKYGVSDVMVFCSDGMCSFYIAEDQDGHAKNEHAASVLAMADSGVYVARINHLSLEQWLEAFAAVWRAAQ